MSVLINLNKNYIDVFYQTVMEEVFENPKSKANMDWVCKIMQYFLMYNPEKSLKNIMKHHILYYLVGNIQISSASMLLTALLTPGDRYFRLPDKHLEKVYNYLDYTEFFNFCLEIITAFNQRKIRDKIDTLLKDENLIETNNPILEFGEKAGTTIKNVFINIFHSFFNIKPLLKNHKQPEDYNMQKTNIDGFDILKVRRSSMDRLTKDAVKKTRADASKRRTVKPITSVVNLEDGGRKNKTIKGNSKTMVRIDQGK